MEGEAVPILIQVSPKLVLLYMYTSVPAYKIEEFSGSMAIVNTVSSDIIPEIPLQFSPPSVLLYKPELSVPA